MHSCCDFKDLKHGEGNGLLCVLGFDGITPYATGQECFYFFTTDLPNAHIELTFTHFDVRCDHTLEVRNFQITQPSIG